MEFTTVIQHDTPLQHSHEQAQINKFTLNTDKTDFITFVANNKPITDMNIRYYDHLFETEAHKQSHLKKVSRQRRNSLT